MKIKTLPTHFRRARFDWEIVERKKVLDHVDKAKKEFIYKDWGLFRQDKHWVVAAIVLMDIDEGSDNQLEFDKIERLTNLKTYMPNEEHLARKEYESK